MKISNKAKIIKGGDVRLGTVIENQVEIIKGGEVRPGTVAITKEEKK
jgi:hypothetical protein